MQVCSECEITDIASLVVCREASTRFYASQAGTNSDTIKTLSIGYVVK
jgi:hypothetical protein